MAKEKEFRRVTMYADPNDATKLGRIELDGVARIVDDVTGEPDEDLGEWVNKAKNYAEDEDPPNFIKNMIKTRLGI